MPVIYTPNGGSSYELRPAPLCRIEKSYVRADDGSRIRPAYQIILTGVIVNVGHATLDSPGAQGGKGLGDVDQMADILAEQKRLRQAFASDGGRLEITSPGGGSTSDIDTYVRVEGVNFNESTWTSRCDYTITLSTHYITNDSFETFEELESYSEDWNFSENQDGTYSVSHTLQATGATLYSSTGTNDALTAAKSWCHDHSFVINGGALSVVTTNDLNFSDLISNISNLTSKSWNYSLVESVGPQRNSWQLTESWIYIPDGQAVEEWSVTPQSDINPAKETITIQGSINGYSDRITDISERNTAASDYFTTSVEPNLYTRVNTAARSGFTVRPNPISKQITYEKTAGSLNYAYTYMAISGSLITNAIEENITINDNNGNDIFAQIPVPGRANGPVVQSMSTKELPERSINITATLMPTNAIGSTASLLSAYLAKPNTDDIINALKPSAGNYYLQENSEQWNPMSREYSRTVSWILQPESNSVDGLPSRINNTGS